MSLRCHNRNSRRLMAFLSERCRVGSKARATLTQPRDPNLRAIARLPRQVRGAVSG